MVGALTGQKMDRTNMVVAVVLIVFMICVAPCLYTSFAHRRVYALDAARKEVNHRFAAALLSLARFRLPTAHGVICFCA